MKITKLDLFCPKCGAREVHIDQDDPGDVYAGTTHYCFACHHRLPDLGLIRDVLWASATVPLDVWDIGRYLEIRESDGADAVGTELIRSAHQKAKQLYDERSGKR
jgi:hypothetical protein